MPILLYGLDVCALTSRYIQSLDFTANRVLMKLFKTSNIEMSMNVEISLTLIYSLQNLTNCDKIWYISSWVNLSYRNVNVFRLA